MSSAIWRSVVLVGGLLLRGRAAAPPAAGRRAGPPSRLDLSPRTALTGTTSAASTERLAASSCSATCFLAAASVLVHRRRPPARCTSRSWRAMNRSPVPDGLVGGTQKHHDVDLGQGVADDVVEPAARAGSSGLCRPGGVDEHELPAGRWTTPRIACRVVCGRLLTMPTFSPTSALVSVVLPALGGPPDGESRSGTAAGPAVSRPILPPGTTTSDGSRVVSSSSGPHAPEREQHSWSDCDIAACTARPDERRPSRRRPTPRGDSTCSRSAPPLPCGLGAKRSATAVPPRCATGSTGRPVPVAVGLTVALVRLAGALRRGRRLVGAARGRSVGAGRRPRLLVPTPAGSP
jgi:hypothetical protein